MPEVLSTPRPRRALSWAIAVFCLVSVVISGRQTFWYFTHGPTVSDFRIFMTGIEMVRSGEGRDLYQFEAQKRAQALLYPETAISGLLPFNHLGFELLYYWPISWLPYRAAIVGWAVINLGIVFLIGWLLRPYTSALRQRTGIPIAFFLLAFYPVIFTLGQGQDSILFLLLLVVSLRTMDANRPSVAGFVLALACFKLHLALAIVFFAFFLRGKWRALAGFAAGSAAVVGISLAMAGPRMISDYLSMLRRQAELTPWGFIPWYMPNLRGLLQWGLAPWLDIGMIIPIIFVLSVIVAVMGGWIILRGQIENDSSLAFSVAILTTILISYHFHMQDLSIAALPVLVLLNRAVAQRSGEKCSTIFGVFETDCSPLCGAILLISVAILYFFRVVAELYPWLVIHGCLLSVPLSLLWVLSLYLVGIAHATPSKLPALQTV